MGLPDKIGVAQPTSGSFTVQHQVEVAQTAEREGFDFVLFPETWGREIFTRLGYVAAHTDEIMLGSGIIPVHSRSAALIGQGFATLAEITNRDVVVGLGLSSNHVITQWHGTDFEPALRRERETIEILRQVVSGEPLGYTGDWFEVEHFRLRFDPPERNYPIYVAAWGEKNCELTGGFADGWMPNHIPVSHIDSLRETVDYGAEIHGRDPGSVATLPFATACVLSDGERARDLVREEIAFYIGSMGEYTARELNKYGFEEEVSAVLEHWENGDRTAGIEAVSDELLREITVSGTPDQARAILEQYDEVGEGVILLPTKAAGVEEVKETVQHVGSLYQ